MITQLSCILVSGISLCILFKSTVELNRNNTAIRRMIPAKRNKY